MASRIESSDHNSSERDDVCNPKRNPIKSSESDQG